MTTLNISENKGLIEFPGNRSVFSTWNTQFFILSTKMSSHQISDFG